jgi:hypothetical protein
VEWYSLAFTSFSLISGLKKEIREERMERNHFGYAFVMMGMLVPFSVSAETSIQPYIDQLKEEMKEASEPETPQPSGVLDPYLQGIRKELKQKDPKDKGLQPYIDELKNLDPKNDQVTESDESYIEREKAKLSPEEERSPIKEVMSGRGDLKPKKLGEIHHAMGFRYGVALSRSYSAPGLEARPFDQVYGQNYSPDGTFFYEYQPFHSEWFGNIGLFGMVGVGFNSGNGQFSYAVPKPTNPTETFPITSGVKFQFYTVPVTAGLNYRFNLARIIRPYIFFGPTAVGYIETRNDELPGHKGASFGLYTTVGAALSLDWATEAWDLYSSFGVKHYYLTFDYLQITTLFGDVNISSSGFLVGLAFEY